MDEPERRIVAEVEVDAPPEQVWQALTEGEEIARWFSFAARAEKGEGGRVWVSWGEPWEGEQRIALWDPPHHLRWAEDANPEAWPPTPLAVDLYLEAKGGKTVLRLVHSGFAASGWDDELDSLSHGWDVFLGLLAVTQTRHRGLPRQVAYAAARYDAEPGLTVEGAWARLLGPRGLVASGEVSNLVAGGRFAWQSADGEALAGRVLHVNPPKDLAVLVEGWNDAHLWVEVRLGFAKLTLSLFGEAGALAPSIEERWRRLLAGLFPAAPAGN